MKKILKLAKPAVAMFFLCIAGALLSGCSTYMPDFNPKALEVDEAWINKFAKPNKTKDVDILHKLCKPTYIFENPNGEKSYSYHSLDSTYKEYTSVNFLFNQNRTLKEVFLYSSLSGDVKSDENLLALLETLPSNPTRQILKKILGESSGVRDKFIIYSYPTQSGIVSIWFKIKSNGRVEEMIVPKRFYEFAKKKHARFKVKTIYLLEREAKKGETFVSRKINEEEAAAIEKCER